MKGCGMENEFDKVKRRWDALDTTHIEAALAHLREYEHDIQLFIADYVAALCDVTVADMFLGSDVVYLAHARWLYWYTYRYATNESFDKIAAQRFPNGHVFVQRTIQHGVNKMSLMIEKEELWNKRWCVLKKILRLRESETRKPKNNIITICVPRELKDTIKIEIKEK